MSDWVTAYKNYRRKAERAEKAVERALYEGIDHVSAMTWAAAERRCREAAEALADLRAAEQEDAR